MRPSDPTSRRRRRLTAVSIASAVAVGAALLLPIRQADPEVAAAQPDSLEIAIELEKAAQGLPHTDPEGMPTHTHPPTDPRFKNALARSAEAAGVADPTSATERRRNANYVKNERARKDPRLTKVRLNRSHPFTPATRYQMANGCYTLRAPDGRYIKKIKNRVVLRRVDRKRSLRFFFKATDLGKYLLYTQQRRFFDGSDSAPRFARQPSPTADWVVKKRGKRFTFGIRGGKFLRADGGSLQMSLLATRFTLERANGCADYPESQIGVSGAPHGGATPIQEVRGFVDGHTHHMAFEFLGGRAHCGRPWHPYGVRYALVDCPDHTATGGNGAALETFLSGEPTHDPVGWPTFKDWPAPNSLTHEGTYYRWMERAWRGGQRLFVNLFVENNKLCEVYPLKKNSCDDMDSIRLQARQIRKFEAYVDAQFGGPGKGFYRIVTSPWEARRVINAGKMAVVLGIETSVPFGCTFKQVGPTELRECTAQDIDRQLTEMNRLGIRQMELVNKFDNALGGVAGDAGETGVIINGANFLETGTFWDMKSCDPPDGESSDRPQLAFPEISAEQQDAFFGAIGSLFGNVLPAVPVYGPPAHCNARGLTDLGELTIKGLADRNMIFDPDHLSEKSRQDALRVIEGMKYPGIISSHSWSTPATYPRIYKAGGFITPYAGDSTGFVEKWRRHLGWADRRYYFGFGFGADINGLGAQGDPRGTNVSNKVNYPFKGINGVTIRKQRAGKRVYDINADGVAQYGLYPDWVEDLTKVAGGADGKAIFDDMSRGPEAYLQMWERAEGIKADSCRNTRLRKNVAKVKKLVRRGMTTVQVMRKVGQPFQRLGNEYGVCAKRPGKKRVFVKIDFDKRGRVTRVRA